MSSSVFFTVIIPTCNRHDLLKLCLDRITPGKQSLASEMYEVIVSDDGTDSAENLMKEVYPWAKWVKGPQRGPASNRNNGVKYAAGEWLVFTDDDCLPQQDWLEKFHHTIRQHSEIKALEGSIHPEGEVKGDLVECPVNLQGNCFWSANICVKKELYQAIGGFDENYRIAAQEDQDLFIQVRKYTRVLFVPEARVVHPVRNISFLKSLRKIREKSLNWAYFADKNKKELSYNSIAGIIGAGYKSQVKALLKALKRGYLGQAFYAVAMLFYGMPVIMTRLLVKNKLSNREFNWVSSKTGDTKVINDVNHKLSGYYSQSDWRDSYEKMLQDQEPLPSKGEFSYLILDYILMRKSESILDIGCGTGRIYRQLKQLGFEGKYTGIEVSEHLIGMNRKRHPEARWETAGAYHIPFSEGEYDLAFAFFVLEHLVYPEKALVEMMRMVKEQGSLVLVFPDFVKSGRLSSQQLGFSPNHTSIQKLKRGKIADAVVSIYDSRVRLPKALKNVHQEVGDFPINTNLICFNHPEAMSPDFDAVYIASKEEVARWATRQGYKVSLPYGEEGELRDKAFLVITK